MEPILEHMTAATDVVMRARRSSLGTGRQRDVGCTHQNAVIVVIIVMVDHFRVGLQAEQSRKSALSH